MNWHSSFQPIRQRRSEVESRSTHHFSSWRRFRTFDGKSTAKPPKAHKLAIFSLHQTLCIHPAQTVCALGLSFQSGEKRPHIFLFTLCILSFGRRVFTSKNVPEKWQDLFCPKKRIFSRIFTWKTPRNTILSGYILSHWISGTTGILSYKIPTFNFFPRVSR